MKITTWNVNSVNARLEHLVNFIKEDQSDIYLLQELKTVEEFKIKKMKPTGKKGNDKIGKRQERL